MAVDAAIVGRTYPPDDVYEVGREVLREFAEATAAGGRPHAAHTDVEAARELGHPDPFSLLPEDWSWWLRNRPAPEGSLGWPAIEAGGGPARPA